MRWILNRALSSAVTLSLLAIALFFLARLAPGGPFDADQKWSPEIQQNILRHYALDLPIPVQFSRWTSALLKGDLGESFQYTGMPVSQLIGECLPISLALGGLALLIAVILGLPVGVIAATRAGSTLDWILRTLSSLLLSIPSYLLAAILVSVFALSWEWFPPALLESWRSYVLPVLALAARPWAMLFRLTRASSLELLEEDFVRAARARGLPELWILQKHVLVNASLPALSLLGPLAAHLLTGSFVVELVFQLPGLGKHFVGAVLNRDYPLIQGLALTFGVALLVLNLGFEIFQRRLDPRLGGKD